jgi:hypothetical protein
MTQPDLTPVAVFTQAAAMVFGASMAMIVGPYIVILIAGMGGAGVAVMQRESTGNFKAFVYFLAMVSASVLFTVPLSMFAASFFGAVQAHWLFAPVSFGIGYLAGNPRAAMTWLATRFTSVVDLAIQMRTPK